MSHVHHTPIPFKTGATSPAVNGPLGQLDQAIKDVQDDIDTLQLPVFIQRTVLTVPQVISITLPALVTIAEFIFELRSDYNGGLRDGLRITLNDDETVSYTSVMRRAVLGAPSLETEHTISNHIRWEQVVCSNIAEQGSYGFGLLTIAGVQANVRKHLLYRGFTFPQGKLAPVAGGTSNIRICTAAGQWSNASDAIETIKVSPILGTFWQPGSAYMARLIQ